MEDPPQGNVGYMGQPAHQLNIFTGNKKRQIEWREGGKKGTQWGGVGELPDVGNRALGGKKLK